MAALLVGLAVMAVMMSVALPVWSQQTRREQEEEYLFRAYQYARGVALFQRKYANTFPPNFDVLVEQRFLRKKYKDPLTGQDFNPVYMTPQRPGQMAGGEGGAASPGLRSPQRPGASGSFGQATPPVGAGGGAGTGGASGSSGFGQIAPTGSGAPAGAAGVMGVVSKSKDSSIRIWNGRSRYDQWAVTYQDIRPGKGLPPDLRNAANGLRPGTGPGQTGGFGQPGAGGVGQPGGVRPGGGFGQPGGTGRPGGFGQPPGTSPFAQPTTSPFGQPATVPGASPFQPTLPPPPAGKGFSPSPPSQPGANPFAPKGSGS
jgi:type II secretory pathway pseudopilin PulG